MPTTKIDSSHNYLQQLRFACSRTEGAMHDSMMQDTIEVLICCLHTVAGLTLKLRCVWWQLQQQLDDYR